MKLVVVSVALAADAQRMLVGGQTGRSLKQRGRRRTKRHADSDHKFARSGQPAGAESDS